MYRSLGNATEPSRAEIMLGFPPPALLIPFFVTARLRQPKRRAANQSPYEALWVLERLRIAFVSVGLYVSVMLGKGGRSRFSRRKKSFGRISVELTGAL